MNMDNEDELLECQNFDRNGCERAGKRIRIVEGSEIIIEHNNEKHHEIKIKISLVTFNVALKKYIKIYLF